MPSSFRIAADLRPCGRFAPIWFSTAIDFFSRGTSSSIVPELITGDPTCECTRPGRTYRRYPNSEMPIMSIRKRPTLIASIIGSDLDLHNLADDQITDHLRAYGSADQRL